jgi:hypothetical protein
MNTSTEIAKEADRAGTLFLYFTKQDLLTSWF